MSAHDDNFLYKAQATTKPNIHFIGLDQLWKVIVQKFGIIYAMIKWLWQLLAVIVIVLVNFSLVRMF